MEEREYTKGFNIGYEFGKDQDAANELKSLIEKHNKAHLAYSRGIMAGINEAKRDLMLDNQNDLKKVNKKKRSH